MGPEQQSAHPIPNRVRRLFPVGDVRLRFSHLRVHLSATPPGGHLPRPGFGSLPPLRGHKSACACPPRPA